MAERRRTRTGSFGPYCDSRRDASTSLNPTVLGGTISFPDTITMRRLLDEDHADLKRLVLAIWPGLGATLRGKHSTPHHVSSKSSGRAAAFHACGRGNPALPHGACCPSAVSRQYLRYAICTTEERATRGVEEVYMAASNRGLLWWLLAVGAVLVLVPIVGPLMMRGGITAGPMMFGMLSDCCGSSPPSS